MPRRFTIIQAPANPEDPDIANAMVTKDRPLVVPDPASIKGHISEDEIGDLAKRDRKTILALSRMDQVNEWQTRALLHIDENIRALDVEQARVKVELARVKSQQKEDGRNWGIVKWATVTILAAVVSTFFRWLVGK